MNLLERICCDNLACYVLPVVVEATLAVLLVEIVRLRIVATSGRLPSVVAPLTAEVNTNLAKVSPTELILEQVRVCSASVA